MRAAAVVGLALLLGPCESYVDLPKPEDLRLVIKPELIRTEKIDPKAFSCGVDLLIGGYRSITCRYDSRNGSYAKDPSAFLFYESGFTRSYIDPDAEKQFSGLLEGWENGLQKMHWEPAEHLLSLGDQHHAAYLVSSEGRVGNAFAVRKGSTVVRLLVTGVTFDDPARVRALMLPLVNEAAKQH
jgi:hypothetical protein